MQAPLPIASHRSRSQAPRTVPLRQSRFWVICLFFFLWMLAIVFRLFWLQIVDHKEFVERADKQQQRTFEVAPRRGVLYDRNLRELAMTVQVDSIYADPSEIDDKAAAARVLSAIVHVLPDDDRTTEQAIEARLVAGHSFAWVARRVTPAVSARVHALKMKGIYYQKEFQRFYPDNQLAAQVLGYVGVDDNGLGGLEDKFDARLHGVPGHMFTAMDARRRILGSSERDPQPGQNLVLTIDENIQFMAEQALEHAMQKTQALNGTVVVQDVHTGQILALAIRPTFNPNQFRYATPSLLRDHAVSDVYEPGSTFKLVTYSAALDQHVVTPDDIIDCQGGQINVAGRIIHDDQSDRGLGKVTIATALARSSDVAAVKLALQLGPDRFYKYIRDFGFGSRTGIELPGETRGLLRPVKRWGASSIGSLAIGQEVAVTPLQLVTMVSTIANGGVYLPPHVLLPDQVDGAAQGQTAAALNAASTLKASPFRPGMDLPSPLPPGAHRVISTLAAAEMRKMMEGVVLFGTGKEAQLNGYSSAGKTGTAQKIDPRTHTYSKTMHIASFAGFAPVNNPVISVAVIMDSPKGSYYGASVSAPVFAEVAQAVLEYLGVPHDIALHVPRTSAKPEPPVKEDETAESPEDIHALYDAANDLPSDDPLRQQPEDSATTQAASTAAGQPTAPTQQHSGNHGSAPLAATPQQPDAPPTAGSPWPAASQSVTLNEARRLRVPSLVGLSMRQAIEQAGGAGMEIVISGNGRVREQAPAPGTMVDPGTKIVVRCAR